MSVERLKRICTNAVALKPDLILITGDLDTIEARNCPHAIQEGFSPLQEYKGKVIACYGVCCNNTMLLKWHRIMITRIFR